MKELLTALCVFMLCACAPHSENAGIYYPPRAMDVRANGVVAVLYDINDAGGTENIRVVRSEPYRMFDQSVKSAIRKWHFAAGKPVKDIPVTVKFERFRPQE